MVADHFSLTSTCFSEQQTSELEDILNVPLRFNAILENSVSYFYRAWDKIRAFLIDLKSIMSSLQKYSFVIEKLECILLSPITNMKWLKRYCFVLLQEVIQLHTRLKRKADQVDKLQTILTEKGLELYRSKNPKKIQTDQDQEQNFKENIRP